MLLFLFLPQEALLKSMPVCLIFLSLLQISVQETRQFLECARPLDSSLLTTPDTPIRIRILSVYGNQIEPGTELALWAAYSNKDFCQLFSKATAKLPSALLVSCDDCLTCNALPSVLAHHAETSFVLTGTDLQPYWFDHINTMTFLKLESALPSMSPDSTCNLAEEVVHYTTFASTALVGFTLILALSLLCLVCVVFLCLRSHHKLSVSSQHEKVLIESQK